MAIIAFRTNNELDEKLRRAAHEEKRTKTEVLREALELYLDAKSGTTRPGKQPTKRGSLAAALKEDIGIWDGPDDASVNTGAQLREILDAKHRSRRV